MMKKLIWAGLLLAGSSTLALADMGAGLIGNTVTLTAADGAVTQVYYSDAAATEVKAPDGAVTSGVWRVEGNKVCRQAGDAPESCTPPLEEPPVVGSAGTIDADDGPLQWVVTAGKGF